MAIVNSVQNTMNGFGNGPGAGVGVGGYVTAAGVALSGASPTPTAVTMGTQGYTNGKIRVKMYAGGSSSTAATVSITVSDGTNTYAIGNFGPYTIANGANSGFDKTFDVLVDIEITTVTFTWTLATGTTTASADYEICLNP